MRFLVHVCFDPATEEKPASCGCRHGISKTERDARVEAGELFVLKDRRTVVEKRRVVRARIFKHLKQASTVDGGRGPRREGHIQRAYGFHEGEGSKPERDRIELFKPGALKKKVKRV